MIQDPKSGLWEDFHEANVERAPGSRGQGSMGPHSGTLTGKTLYMMNMHEGGPTGGSHYCVKSLTAPYLVYTRCPGALLI